ncbi:MAG: EpsG family protein [Clostridiales bacterium]|nr:EpsG family protein [Clostridiales bacterium]
MVQYYLLIALVLFTWLIVDRQSGERFIRSKPLGKSPLIAVFLFLSLAIVAGLRYRVGVDYPQYALNYDAHYSPAGFLEIIRVQEPGIYVLAKIGKLFYADYASFFFVSALFTIGLVVITIGKYSPVVCLSILLYMLMGGWHVTFNAIRQCAAAAVVFAGHRLILERKFWRYAIVIFFGGLFHVSAWLLILPYFFAGKNLDKRQWTIIAIIVLVGMLSYDRIFSFVDEVRGQENYLLGAGGNYATRVVQLPRILVSWAPILLLYFFKERKTWSELPLWDTEKEFYANLTLFNAALVTASMNSAYFARIGIYTNLYAVIGIPHILELAPNKKVRSLVTALCVALYIVYWFVEAGGLQEWKWIWQR